MASLTSIRRAERGTGPNVFYVAAEPTVLDPLAAIGAGGSGLQAIVPGALAVGGIAVTGVLLVWDLARPGRFYRLFTRPQWRSWPARGTYVVSAAAGAVLAGAGALAVLAAVVPGSASLLRLLAWAVLAAVGASAGLIALDVFGRHRTAQAQRAARKLLRDRFARRFRLAGDLLVAAAVLAGAFVAAPSTPLLAIAGALALAGLWLDEDVWMRAGQSVPLS